MATIRLDDASFRSADRGEQIALTITEMLRAGQSISIDFASVEIMTPSFANALVMTLLESFSLAELKSRCEFSNRSPAVIDVMNLAVTRFARGIRLSGHAPTAA